MDRLKADALNAPVFCFFCFGRLEKEFMIKEDRLLTYKDLQDILHVGKNRAYELLHSECFPTIRINNRLYVNSRHLSEWLDTYAGKSFLV